MFLFGRLLQNSMRSKDTFRFYLIGVLLLSLSGFSLDWSKIHKHHQLLMLSILALGMLMYHHACNLVFRIRPGLWSSCTHVLTNTKAIFPYFRVCMLGHTSRFFFTWQNTTSAFQLKKYNRDSSGNRKLKCSTLTCHFLCSIGARTTSLDLLFLFVLTW